MKNKKITIYIVMCILALGSLNAQEINTHKINLNLSIYPNPSVGFFNINIRNYNNETMSFQLYNVLGEFVKKGKITEKTTFMSIGNLQNGIYLLEVKKENKLIKVFKIIKQ